MSLPTNPPPRATAGCAARTAACRPAQVQPPGDRHHREIYYQCTNVVCGHTWKASETYDYGLVPSATPDPRVTLPQRPART
jgi:hypothetical protein